MENIKYYGCIRKDKDNQSYFCNVYTNELQCYLCGVEQPIELGVRIRREDEPETPYWGWLGKNKNYFSLIQPSKLQFEMCFIGGLEVAERAGGGKGYNIVIWELTKS